MISDRQQTIIILDTIHSFSIYDIRKILKMLNQKKVEFKFLEKVPAGIYCYALVLTNNLKSINSDNQRPLI